MQVEKQIRSLSSCYPVAAQPKPLRWPVSDPWTLSLANCLRVWLLALPSSASSFITDRTIDGNTNADDVFDEWLCRQCFEMNQSRQKICFFCSLGVRAMKHV